MLNAFVVRRVYGNQLAPKVVSRFFNLLVGAKHSGHNLLVESKDICRNADAYGTLRERPYKSKRTVFVRAEYIFGKNGTVTVGSKGAIGSDRN